MITRRTFLGQAGSLASAALKRRGHPLQSAADGIACVKKYLQP